MPVPTATPSSFPAATARPWTSRDGDTYRGPDSLSGLVKQLPLRVLSAADHAHWQRRGWVVVREAITTEHAVALLDFAWRFQGLDPHRPDTWHAPRRHRSDLDRDLHVYGFVEAYHHQLIWDSRQSRRVYDAFVDIWDATELWVTLDRLNLNPPNRGPRDRSLITRTDRGFDIELHWDVDTTLTRPPQRVQATIALTDTADELGGFQCCPELFERFAEWAPTQPPDRDPYRPTIDRTDFPVERPRLRAGDLLIWNGLLAHGVAANTSIDGVRAVQYLSMMPALPAHEQLRAERVSSWRTLSTPTWNATLLGDAVRPEAHRYGPATLTELGSRLLGATLWPDPASGHPTTGELR